MSDISDYAGGDVRTNLGDDLPGQSDYAAKLRDEGWRLFMHDRPPVGVPLQIPRDMKRVYPGELEVTFDGQYWIDRRGRMEALQGDYWRHIPAAADQETLGDKIAEKCKQFGDLATWKYAAPPADQAARNRVIDSRLAAQEERVAEQAAGALDLWGKVPDGQQDIVGGWINAYNTVVDQACEERKVKDAEIRRLQPFEQQAAELERENQCLKSWNPGFGLAKDAELRAKLEGHELVHKALRDSNDELRAKLAERAAECNRLQELYSLSQTNFDKAMENLQKALKVIDNFRGLRSREVDDGT